MFKEVAQVSGWLIFPKMEQALMISTLWAKKFAEVMIFFMFSSICCMPYGPTKEQPLFELCNTWHKYFLGLFMFSLQIIENNYVML